MTGAGGLEVQSNCCSEWGCGGGETLTWRGKQEPGHRTLGGELTQKRFPVLPENSLLQDLGATFSLTSPPPQVSLCYTPRAFASAV